MKALIILGLVFLLARQRGMPLPDTDPDIDPLPDPTPPHVFKPGDHVAFYDPSDNTVYTATIIAPAEPQISQGQPAPGTYWEILVTSGILDGAILPSFRESELMAVPNALQHRVYWVDPQTGERHEVQVIAPAFTPPDQLQPYWTIRIIETGLDRIQVPESQLERIAT
jgi:hypothetical protein